MASSTTKQPRILALAFPDLNILDLTGPAEVLCNSSLSADQARLAVASATEVTRSCEGVSLTRDLSFTDLLLKDDNGHYPELERFDVLVVPGAPPQYVEAAIKNDRGLLRIVKTFAELKSNGPAGRDRWLFSICIGAGFLGTINLLSTKTCTTHFGYIPRLKEVSIEAAGGDKSKAANVVRKRFVDSGKTDSGVRILTAGGVSCGLDASLWLVGQIYSKQQAEAVARVMDYKCENVGNKVTEGWEV